MVKLAELKGSRKLSMICDMICDIEILEGLEEQTGGVTFDEIYILYP